MDECLFCKMIAGDIPADVVYQDDDVLAFRDINPQAPVHVLIIPKRHISTLNDLASDDAALIGKLSLAAAKIAVQEGIAESGYRTLINTNREGGQVVFHIHMHLMGGRRMLWPPG
ncbi:MAG: histidine triad nucleotide-binding protein [Sedimenticola sp.]|uniref:Histidine triad nucleotide-binding protein n=1 Tax=Sedimenticola thiotaurini TaxID=1543721 RepID=A0A558D473_9GAMM|nr:histidine triad nucleotide-binding protein [Sedimenticola sp.]TVT55817.1 MAG: histidine triad nucleotide-binding protein [Sedimenticola thiotaurini]MCW8920667.1 histidine triad nucleotide-binding protein [Sedimenticola sp.]MCW8946791.1 histidine triad nucleotide-binding protein [Sedimenticola sp.]MCW8949253.1 histidine triad nucleotide-binding protein [Sedimenticola sp.]